MHRRSLLGVAAISLIACGAGSALTSAVAHTPYRQWQVYRRKHLLLGCHKDAPHTYRLAKQLAEVLAEQLPRSAARVARAPTAQRLASLLATEQLDVAILGDHDAVEMAAGIGRFKPYGPVALRTLLRLPEHLLVCRETFPEHHAALVAEVLRGHAATTVKSTAEPPLPWHAGTISH